MSPIDELDRGVTVLVVGARADVRERLAHDLDAILAGTATVTGAEAAAEVVSIATAAEQRHGLLPVVFVDVDQRPAEGAATIAALRADGVLGTTRVVLVTESTSLHGVDRALRAGAVHGMITTPWTAAGLQEMLEAQLATHLVEHAPDLLDRFADLLDDDDRRRATQRVEQRRRAPEATGDRAHPVLQAEADDEEVEAALVDALDRALGHPPRIRIAPGTTMIESGDDVGGIYVILDGVVRLTSTTDDGEVILHERTTGAIVGLLSLASHRRALLTCTSVTGVRAIPVTLDQLARAMEAEPEVATLLNRVLIASLARRLRRSDVLQAELDRSLAALSEARAQLVANARFTTLGELSAGMAHELNNPTAALQRSIDHLDRDLMELLDPHDAAVVEEQLRTDATPPTAAERRARRRELARHFDARFAERLVDLGATDLASARHLAALSPEDLDRRESAHRLGTTLRNAARAAKRVQALVDSLRAYARGDDGRGALVPDVDLERTIDSALRLVAHRVGTTTVEREFADDIPPIVARPGALQHVWTNLLTNAFDALDGGGTVTVRTRLDGDRVSVEVEDDGPGVPPDLIDRIFEPRFTTKEGRVSFGLGLGLSIARQIVGDHGGTITVDSRPGRTVFTVVLPVTGPANHTAFSQEEPDV